MKTLLPVALLLLLTGCATISGPRSARHYVDTFEDDLIAHKFTLLGRKEVQKDLHIDENQLREIESTYRTPPLTMPGGQDICAITNRDEKMKQFRIVTETYHQSRLDTILTPTQTKRLQELLIQMRGPAIISFDPTIRNELNFTSDQTRRMDRIMAYSSDDLRVCVSRYGRLFLCESRRSQTEPEQRREMNALVCVIEEIIKGRDEDILSVLTKDQRVQFDQMQGKPLAIRWSRHDLLYGPFQGKSKAPNQALQRTPLRGSAEG